jgi:hypothetical protein
VAGCGDDKKSTNSTPPNPVKSAHLDFESHYLDLETGNVDTVFGIDSPAAEMDINLAYNSVRVVHTVVFQTSGRQIAHLPSRTFASVTVADTTGAPFTSNLVDTSFDANRVIMVKTNVGGVYKLGNPVETADYTDGCTFDYAKLTD